VTDNDERNAPMLAINRRLGYEPFAVRTRLRQGALSGNGLRASAGSTCAVTHTGVVA
jgi:hypothetical protein